MNNNNNLRIDEINEEETPQNLNNNNIYFDDMDNIIINLAIKIIANLINYRLEKLKNSNLFYFIFLYSQIKRTNKKKRIFKYVLKNIFNTLENLINDSFILLNFNNEELYNINNLIHYKWNFLNDNIKDTIKFKVLEELIYTNQYKQYEENIKHFGTANPHFIRFYNRTRYIDKKYNDMIRFYIMEDRIYFKLEDIINNEYIKGLFLIVLNHNLNNMLFNDEEEEEEEEDINNFDFFALSYNNSPPVEEETEEKQKQKIKEIKNKNYILINKTNLYYIDYTNITTYIKFYKILKVNKDCSLCLENNNNVYRFQAVGSCCRCPSFWCFDCLIYNSYKNNKNNICDFKCLICKKPYINYTKNLTFTNLLNTGYYEQIKKDLFKIPFKISTINNCFNSYEDAKSYIKDSIKLHSYNMPDFSKLIYNDIKEHYNILDELKKKVFNNNYNNIITFNKNNKSLLTKKYKYNKSKLKKLNINIIINLIENYKNIIRLDYELIRNDKILLDNYKLLIIEKIRRKK